jgi:hypothetical protein
MLSGNDKIFGTEDLDTVQDLYENMSLKQIKYSRNFDEEWFAELERRKNEGVRTFYET